MRRLLPFVVASLALFACNDGLLVSGNDGPTPTPTSDPSSLGSIAGRVCAPSGEHWLAGASVRTEDRNPAQQTFTDADGYFELRDVSTGPVTLAIEKGSFTTSVHADVVEGTKTTLSEPACVGVLHVAVIEGYNDDVLPILLDLGLTDTDVYDDPGDLLLNKGSLLSYDLLFINCGAIDFLAYAKDPTMIANLRAFVGSGGSLYASDWAYAFVEVAFPEAIDFAGNDDSYLAATVGQEGNANADVEDPVLADVLGGSSLPVVFDLHSWAVMSETGPATAALVRGDAPGAGSDRPLMVLHRFESGRIGYTSFHTSAQSNAAMMRTLQYLVFEL